jgi:hypothetical protein
MWLAVEVHCLNRIVAVASYAIPRARFCRIVFQGWKQEIKRFRVYKIIGERLFLRVSVLFYDLFMRN